MTGLLAVISILLAVSVSVNIMLLLRRSSGFSREMNSFLSKVSSGRLNLSGSFSTTASGGVQKEIVSSLNTVMEKTRAVLKSVSSTGLNLTTTSDLLKSSSKQMLDMAETASQQASHDATAMGEMSATINEIAQSAEKATLSIGKLKENAELAERGIKENVRSIEVLSSEVATWVETNRALAKATDQIDEIILVINDIADQTNLLALNAAIEAARAGEHGRGFAVVADEVRKLADKTGKATQEIASMIKDIKSKAENSSATMDSTVKGVAESIDRAKSADGSLQQIVAEVKEMADMVNQIAVATSEQSQVANDVLSNIEEAAKSAAQTKELALGIAKEGDAMTSLAISLYSQLCSIKKDKLDEDIEMFLRNCAAELTRKLEGDLKNGRLSRDALFDEHYVQEKEAGKYSTKFSAYFESEVLPLLKQWAQFNKRIIYVVSMDKNAYIPAHLMPARSRVKMSDPVSVDGARSSAVIGQAFRRPLEAGGEVVNDIVCPLVVEGRHWGCLRIGYMPEL